MLHRVIAVLFIALVSAPLAATSGYDDSEYTCYVVGAEAGGLDPSVRICPPIEV